MARKVLIRGGAHNRVTTSVSQLEQMIKADFKEIWKQHTEELESMAEEIQANALELVPVGKTGKLAASINVRVSKSYRYPGIIAHATANNHGFDYALMQDQNENYSHEQGYAHYLSGPFASALKYWYEEATGKELDLPEELEHAANYSDISFDKLNKLKE